jgi:hypothetical protein
MQEHMAAIIFTAEWPNYLLRKQSMGRPLFQGKYTFFKKVKNSHSFTI